MNTVLTICIASYNKAELTYSLVKTILENKNEKLNVVVVDNSSSDNTLELLQNIKDNRFSFIVNTYNIGGSANMVHSIYMGSGFCLYCNDRDLIYPEKLDDFIDFLEKNTDYSCGWVSRVTPKMLESFSEYDTLEAFEKMCWRGEHPTGFFFNSRFLKEYKEDFWEEYINPKGWTAFPFENIQAELVTKGKFARYNIPVWHSTGNETHNKYISEFEKINLGGDRWFYVNNCINRGEAYLNQFWNLCSRCALDVDEKRRYSIYSNIILGEQKIGAWRYKSIYESKSLSYHYSVNPKNVPKKEIKENSRQIIGGLIEIIRKHENKTSKYEKIIYDAIKASDSKTKKSFFLKKIAKLRIVKVIRGKKR